MTATTESTGSAKPMRRRDKGTRKSVILADKAADTIIRVGGLGVILAVFGIMAYLVSVVVPLLGGGDVTDRIEHAMPAGHGPAVFEQVDDYRTMIAALSPEGVISAVHIATGTPLAAPAFDFGGATVTTIGHTIANGDVAFGFADGTVRFGRLGFETKILPANAVPAGLRGLDDHDLTDGKSVFRKVPGGQVRQLSLVATLDPAVEVSPGNAIRAIDLRVGGTVERPTSAFVTLDAAGGIKLSLSESRQNMMTGKITLSTQSSTLPPLAGDLTGAQVLLTQKADQVYVAEKGGRIHRFDTRDFQKPLLAETVRLLAAGVELTKLGFLIGEQSLVAGGSDGSVSVFFRLPRDGVQSTDGRAMVLAHKLDPQKNAIVGIAPSQRSRLFVTADAGGGIWLRHSTSEQVLLKLRLPEGAGLITGLSLSPREDAIVAVTDHGRYYGFGIQAPHPETTWKSIFGKIWYEGYDAPNYTWQSSSGNDSFEPKLSLIPLIFGTIKAAFYSLLFAVPIAIGAAIYTSEFVHPRVRAVVKPTMEMMASLPSVVLGFIAALILAPIVETWISAVILAFIALPLGLLIAAHLWQMVPLATAMRYGGLPKFLLMFVAVLVSGGVAYALGPWFEKLIFAGDLKAWAAGQIGSDVPFMALILTPIGFIAAAWVLDRFAPTLFKAGGRSHDRLTLAVQDVVRWGVLLVVGFLIALMLAGILTAVGITARGGIVDTYVQRNTLVVGFAMGFAVIPIVYTIAEDALNAVPEHLRAASLGCGASPWQTAIWVILPTAASGVFAAVMVGLGRAVGETMIVVMAAGNTPVLEWNLFSGLRALSANIAVELPEAVKDSTLFRMLFLAALVLFVMTFVINTVSEIVRQRFRKRAAQL